jgi:hypothetical protein
MNTPISTLEIAKLLKTKGFDKECRLCMEDGDERALPFNCGNTLHKNSIHPYYSVPTVTEVLMWLYEEHGIWISVFSTDDVTMFSYKISSKFGQHYSPNFNSPTEAYEAGIKYVLEKLI